MLVFDLSSGKKESVLVDLVSVLNKQPRTTNIVLRNLNYIALTTLNYHIIELTNPTLTNPTLTNPTLTKPTLTNLELDWRSALGPIILVGGAYWLFCGGFLSYFFGPASGRLVAHPFWGGFVLFRCSLLIINNNSLRPPN